ncbi:FtsH protease activity modulator HflK [Emcibacter nanhaiensis]|uniref:Protein HflK n=1 Tax=Emcibacter nanhaiensis TaxID=1505037 RepID=A0A501PC59_9PROT|nr:FtsH protease activity modulator HflK [Emcibacter nanhaiensis]TPD57587.1 FtsH protease activity modulator HflK [Emcibacter nanhaiensis]
MPWQSNGGGGDRGPWGQGPRRGGGGGQEPPNIEDLIRKGQDKFKNTFSGNVGGGKGFSLLLLLVIGGWLLTGFYRVNTNEAGVVLRFGEWTETTSPGLHYHLPAPIETVIKPKVTEINQIDIGFKGTGSVQGINYSVDLAKERQMLTGDENIVDVEFSVLWRISDAGKYLFKVDNPAQTIRTVAQSAVRDIIARTPIQQALTAGRGSIEREARENIQAILDEYESGVEVTQIKLTKVDPPAQVIEAFREVQRAEADREKTVNQAEAYKNDIVPRARGEAAKMMQEAEAYKAQVIAKAEGEASRFLAVYEEYKQAKDVTRKRMYLETMEQILANIDKVLIEKEGGVVPYLPLNELKKKQ